MFTTSYSKTYNAFSVIEFIAQFTLKLINQAWCKNLGNRVFKVKIIAEFIFTFKNNL